LIFISKKTKTCKHKYCLLPPATIKSGAIQDRLDGDLD
jgi:hypothetical protein